MTDTEIIKALEEMSAEHDGNFSGKVLDLIQRQQVEIKKLKTDYKAMKKDRDNCWKEFKCLLRICETEKAEAVKEFAEAVKLEFYKEFEEIIPSVMSDRIDSLVKERVVSK